MKSIAIIEDDAAYCKFMELILTLEGFECKTAADGHLGLDCLREKAPDLILCDILMKKLDGYSVLKAVKKDPALDHIPFIFVTGLDDRSDLRFGMTSGADDYLIKPFTDEELVSAVVGRLHRYELIRLRYSHSAFEKEARLLQQRISPREKEVLCLVGRGLTSKKIADQLNISFKTAQAHRANLMRKLDAVNAAHLSRWAVIAELLTS
jgi:two-component system, OmpR family, response regulator